MPHDKPQAISTPSTINARPITPKSAEHCGHLLHPGGPQTFFICPPCKVSQLLSELQALTEIWEQNGGPACAAAHKHALYWKIVDAWRPTKAKLAKFVYHLETFAERERAWDARNPGLLDAWGARVRTSAAALEVARRNTPYLEWRDGDAEVGTGKGGCGGLSKKKEKKKVRFDRDGPEMPGRRRDAFKRTSAQYSPGRWSLSTGIWLDTSFALETRFGTPEYERRLDEIWNGIDDG